MAAAHWGRRRRAGKTPTPPAASASRSPRSHSRGPAPRQRPKRLREHRSRCRKGPASSGWKLLMCHLTKLFMVWSHHHPELCRTPKQRFGW